MNEKYYVNFNSFEEYKTKVEDKINEFRQEVLNVFQLNYNVEWTGDGYNSISNLINQEIDDLNYIPQVLDLYVDFMDKAINNYTEGMEEIKESFEELLETIRAEKIKRGEIEDGN